MSDRYQTNRELKVGEICLSYRAKGGGLLVRILKRDTRINADDAAIVEYRVERIRTGDQFWCTAPFLRPLDLSERAQRVLGSLLFGEKSEETEG